jgi:Fe-Mn family superoxide dismutase
MREIINLVESKSQSKDEIEIVNLSYSSSALSPVFSSSLMKLHYEKLAHGYAERFNKKDGDPTFNYAGAWLHNVFFTQFRPSRMNNVPNGPIGNMIKTKFKSFDAFKDAFEQEAMKLHGSGWLYLARDASIKSINNHQVRNDILILVDMWEHAYQHDYGSNKQKYLDNIWKIMDWNVLNTRWGQGYK